jgi:hypothetical protein
MSSASSLARKPMVANDRVRKPAKRAEAEDRHQQDGDDDLVERPRECDDAAADEVDRKRRDVARAPSPIGIEIRMPTTVEATVMITLSTMPSLISRRGSEIGLKKEAMKAQPRLSPS